MEVREGLWWWRLVGGGLLLPRSKSDSCLHARIHGVKQPQRQGHIFALLYPMLPRNRPEGISFSPVVVTNKERSFPPLGH